MPPQCTEKSLKVDVTQAALPFNAPVYEKNEAKDQIEGGGSEQATSSNSQVEANTNSVDNSFMRITTRARHTYELDRYKKNAMLIIDNRSYRGKDNTEHNLDKAFQKFRFEVEKYYYLDEDEISDVCRRFFQRDFTEYGAVAIALMAKTEIYRGNSHSDYREHIFTSNFTVNLPATLKGKPIIYISEIPDYTNRREPLMYPDILNFHIPNSVISYARPEPRLLPIEILSCLLNEFGDEKPLLDIMNSTISDIVRTWPFYQKYPIRICSTLTKELVLVQS